MRDKRGRFLPGPDRDRHPLTRRERQRGFRHALAAAVRSSPDQGAWLYWRVKAWYRAR
jgi:hypothetical protein